MERLWRIGPVEKNSAVDEDDDLSPAIGILTGCVISGAIWSGMALIFSFLI